jgi:hypothetical protein
MSSDKWERVTYGAAMATPHLGAPGTVLAAPHVPGWTTKHVMGENGGQYVAYRVLDLTDYQKQYGCLMRVAAKEPKELECLCIAQLVLAAMVDKAASGVL